MLDRDQPVPDHLHTVTPRLVTRNAPAAIDFYVAAFGAETLDELDRRMRAWAGLQG